MCFDRFIEDLFDSLRISLPAKPVERGSLSPIRDIPTQLGILLEFSEYLSVASDVDYLV